VPIFTELLSILKSKTDNLLSLESIEDINTTVVYVIPVLETIEERILADSDRLAFGQTARELFFSILNIAKEHYMSQQVIKFSISFLSLTLFNYCSVFIVQFMNFNPGKSICWKLLMNTVQCL
jgi:hypothetical protein